MATMHHSLRSFRRRTSRRAGIVSALALLAVHAAPMSAQSPGGRLQFVLPPSTWRLTVSGEVLPAASVKSDALRPAVYPRDVGMTRATARLSAPVWKRGLYTTIVTNDIIYDRFDISYGRSSAVTLPGQEPAFGPATLHSVQHELVVSHAITPRWRATGALQHGLFTTGGSLLEPASYRAAGGAFVSRVYRPTLQVGAGIVALNVAPYVIPTIRVLHVGQKWRTDILLPRAETFRDVGHGVEVGGVLRFVGNRWTGAEEARVVQRDRVTRTTYQQAMLGPALTLRVASRGLVQVEGGMALRRMLVEGTSVPTSGPASRFARRLDTDAGTQLRLSGRLTF